VPIGAVEIDDLELDPPAAAGEANVEGVPTDVDASSADLRADDVEPSSDCGEVPLENLGSHGLSLLAAGIDLGGAARQKPRLSVHLPVGDRRSRRVPRGEPIVAYVSFARKGNDVFYATRQPFNPGSSTAFVHIASDRRPTWRGFGARALRTSL
jgi:hypothetical protein